MLAGPPVATARFLDRRLPPLPAFTVPGGASGGADPWADPPALGRSSMAVRAWAGGLSEPGQI